MTQKIGTNPPPTYSKPPPPKANKGYEGMSNAEVYGALALILIELQEINARLDNMVNSKEPTEIGITFNNTMKGTK